MTTDTLHPLAAPLTVLDKLGDPEAIIAAETPHPDELPAPAASRPAYSSGCSRSARPAQKLCYGIADGVQHCTNARGQRTPSNILGVAVFAFLVLAPIATSIYLTRRAA